MEIKEDKLMENKKTFFVIALIIIVVIAIIVGTNVNKNEEGADTRRRNCFRRNKYSELKLLQKKWKNLL